MNKIKRRQLTESEWTDIRNTFKKLSESTYTNKDHINEFTYYNNVVLNEEGEEDEPAEEEEEDGGEDLGQDASQEPQQGEVSDDPLGTDTAEPAEVAPMETDPVTMGATEPMVGDVSTEDEVVEIDELVDQQEEVASSVEELSGKLDKVLELLQQFDTRLGQSEKLISNVGKELEKRLPTDIEELDLHSIKGFPYNVKTRDFWTNQEKSSNYRVKDGVPTLDGESEDDVEYVITMDDVKTRNF